MLKIRVITGLLILLFFNHSRNLLGQENDSVFSDEPIFFPSDFFDNEEPVHLKLEFNVKQLSGNKDVDEYMPAIFSVYLNDSVEIKKPVKLKPRGNARKDHCFFPPYMLNFKKSDVEDDLPSDINKIKVVTHCMSSNEYNGYLFKEYLAYKLLNILTDYSFRVRMAKITYVDTGRKNKTSVEWAFLIEPEEMMAERLDALPIKLEQVTYGMTDTIHTAIMSMFQYFIGNTDYSLAGRHNIKFLKMKDFTKPNLIPVPYDFDYSGLVKASYSVPHPKIMIKTVTERYYYDICRSDSAYIYVINFFKDKKDELFSYINNNQIIDRRSKKYALIYLRQFYKEIEKSSFIKNKLRSTCTGK